MVQPNSHSPIHIITGATSGLGLAAALAMAKSPQVHLIVGARNFERARTLVRSIPKAQLTLLELDVADLGSVERFCDQVITALGGRSISSLCLNAGLQFSQGDLKSTDGFELTFATNVLGHFLLHERLRTHLAPGARVITIGSGTQNPSATTARRFGYRDAVYTSAAALAHPLPTPQALTRTDPPEQSSPVQQGRDAYGASKRACVMFAKAMATRNPGAAYLSFHPGPMGGTGLARHYTLFARLLWNSVLRLILPLTPEGSTAERSGKVLAQLLTDSTLRVTSGDYIDFRLQEGPAHPQTFDPALQAELLDTCTRLIEAGRGALRFSSASR